jgi:hypothetical protein
VLEGRLPEKGLVGRKSNRLGLARPVATSSRLGLLRRAAARQGLSLRQTVCDQQVVMMRVGVGRRCGDEEVDGNDLRPLMDELEEGMLAVGARFAPDDWTRRSLGGRPVEPHALAVALHLQLLEIGGKAPEPLVVGITACVAWPRILRFQTLRSPISMGMFCAIGASRKCWSMS